jgi:serralysin
MAKQLGRRPAQESIDAAFMRGVTAPGAQNGDVMDSIGLALDLYSTAMSIKDLIEGGDAAALAEINRKLDQLLVVSKEILSGIGQTQNLIFIQRITDIQSDVQQSLRYADVYRTSGRQADADMAISKSIEALYDISTYPASQAYERGLLAATAIAAVAARVSVIRELQDGATSAEHKADLQSAIAALTAGLPALEEQAIAGMINGGYRFDWDGSDGEMYTVWFFNADGERTPDMKVYSLWGWGVGGDGNADPFTDGNDGMRAVWDILAWMKHRSPDNYYTHIEPLIEGNREKLYMPEVNGLIDDLAFLTSGAWLRGRDGTVNDRLTSNQSKTYISPDTLDGYRGNDRLTAGAGNDTVRGGEGSDTLFGMAGADVLRGGEGGDVLDGGPGDDRIDGGAGVDRVSYASAKKAVTVSLDLGDWQDTGGGGRDLLSAVENLDGSRLGDTLTGSLAANQIRGLAGNDRIEGLAGDDVLDGGEGNDVLSGGKGADRLVGGAGVDIATYAASKTGVTVSLATPKANTGDAKGDTFDGVEGLLGTAASDRLTGSKAGADRLDGGDGHDVLKGLGGNDILTGGLGDDIFVVDTAQNPKTNVDTITDFAIKDDSVHLSKAIFQAFKDMEAGDAVPNSWFKDLKLGAVDANDRLVYDRTTGEVFYDADGSGKKFGAVLFLTVDEGTLLTGADFIVF